MDHDDEHQQQQRRVSIGSSACDKLPPLLSSSSKKKIYPWFIVQNLQEDEDDMCTEFYSTLHDPPLIKYQSEIPEVNGRRIRGCFHGWLILSSHPDNVMWSLWNPVCLKTVCLPPLMISKDGDGKSSSSVYEYECLLTAPPDDPTSVLLLARCDASTFVFCHLSNHHHRHHHHHHKRRRMSMMMMRWTEMSYAKQLKIITYDGELLHSLSCCSNGKIYALNADGYLGPIVIQVEIVVVGGEEEVMIQLMMFGGCPLPDSPHRYKLQNFMRGHGKELFCINVCFNINNNDNTTEKIGDVYLFRLDTSNIKSGELECLKKWDVSGLIVEEFGNEDILQDLDITRVMWEEMYDLKDAIFYLDLGRRCRGGSSIFYNPTVSSSDELLGGGGGGGGYIHIRDEIGRILYLYHVRDRTMVASLMPSRVVPTTHVSMWEENHVEEEEEEEEEAKCCSGTVVKREKGDDQTLKTLDEHNEESLLLNIPFDLLERITKHCLGVEYLKLRATCKRCRLTAQPIRWSNESSIRRLHNYSLNSPSWLIVVDKRREIVTFTDPLSGDNYFMKKNSHLLSIAEDGMYCSRYGWLLFESTEFECPVFFNPFTSSDVLKLPEFGDIVSLCFSAPPNSNSSDCIVAGFSFYEGQWYFIYLVVGGGAQWRFVPVGDNNNNDNDDDCKYSSLTFIGRDLYALVVEDGEFQVVVFKNLCNEEEIRITALAAKAPPSTGGLSCYSKYYLMNWDEHLLLVIVGDEYGEVEVFLNRRRRRINDDDDDDNNKWENILDDVGGGGIGKHTIYIGGSTMTSSVCVNANTSEMENKIYFPELVWFSLETRTYHSSSSSSDGEKIVKYSGDFLGTKTHFNSHAWIQPSWC